MIHQLLLPVAEFQGERGYELLGRGLFAYRSPQPFQHHPLMGRVLVNYYEIIAALGHYVSIIDLANGYYGWQVFSSGNLDDIRSFPGASILGITFLEKMGLGDGWVMLL